MFQNDLKLVDKTMGSAIILRAVNGVCHKNISEDHCDRLSPEVKTARVHGVKSLKKIIQIENKVLYFAKLQEKFVTRFIHLQSWH